MDASIICRASNAPARSCQRSNLNCAAPDCFIYPPKPGETSTTAYLRDLANRCELAPGGTIDRVDAERLREIAHELDDAALEAREEYPED